MNSFQRGVETRVCACVCISLVQKKLIISKLQATDFPRFEAQITEIIADEKENIFLRQHFGHYENSNHQWK